MKHKGYTAIIEFDEESGTLFGRVIGLRDMITFQGESVAEVVQAFHDSVDDYLEFCVQRGESPEKPYSGQFVLRIDPLLHREIASTAEARRMSLNALIENVLTGAFPTTKGALKSVLSSDAEEDVGRSPPVQLPTQAGKKRSKRIERRHRQKS
jgi:predicted HicB family RNase H-like nuclease